MKSAQWGKNFSFYYCLGSGGVGGKRRIKIESQRIYFGEITGKL